MLAALILVSVKTALNAIGGAVRASNTIRQDFVEGLRYLWGQPVIRNITIVIALTNFLEVTIDAQLVLFAKEHVGANRASGWGYSTRSAGQL